LIAELNLEDAMNRQSFLNLNHNPYAASSSDNKRSKWSDIISNVIDGKVMNDNEQTSGSEKEEAIKAQKFSLWESRYKNVIVRAEHLQEILISHNPSEYHPSQQIISEKYKLDKIFQNIDFNQDLVRVPLKFDHGSKKAFIFMIPRYYRGINDDEELISFLDLCSVIKKQLEIYHQYHKPLPSSSSLSPSKLDIVPLHPLMVDKDGNPDYSRRAPYPGIIFFEN